MGLCLYINSSCLVFNKIVTNQAGQKITEQKYYLAAECPSYKFVLYFNAQGSQLMYLSFDLFV